MKISKLKTYYNNNFYFRIFIEFESDYDVKNLENIISLKPYKTISRSECYENTKKAVVYEEDGSTHKVTPRALFFYKSKVFDGIDVGCEFKKFLLSIDSNLEKVIPLLKEYKGTISFYVALHNFKKCRPCVYFDNETIKLLSKYDSYLDIYYD